MRRLGCLLLASAVACQPSAQPKATPPRASQARVAALSSCDVAKKSWVDAHGLEQDGRLARALLVEQGARELCPTDAKLGHALRLRALAELGRDTEARQLAHQILGNPDAAGELSAQARTLLASKPRRFGTSRELFSRAAVESDTLALDRALVALEQEQGEAAGVQIMQRRQPGHAMSDDAAWVAFAEDGAVSVWQTSRAAEVRRFPTFGVPSAMLLDRGRLFVASRRYVRPLWDRDTVREERQQFAVEAWDVATGERRFARRSESFGEAQLPNDPIPGSDPDCSAAFCLSPDRRTLIDVAVASAPEGSACFDKVEIHDVTSDAQPSKRFEVRAAACPSADQCLGALDSDLEPITVSSVLVDAAWTKLAVRFSDDSLRLIDLRSGDVREVYEFGEIVAISKGFRFAYSNRNLLWDTTKPRARPLKASPYCGADSALFSPDGDWLYTGGFGHACGYETHGSGAALTYPRSGPGIGSLVRPALGPHGREVFLEHDLHILGRFSVPDARPLSTPFSVQRIERADGSVALVNAAGEPVLDMEPEGAVRSTGASADDWLLGGAMFSDDGEVSLSPSAEGCPIRSTRTGALLAQLPSQHCIGPGLSADGRFVVNGGERALISAETGKVIFAGGEPPNVERGMTLTREARATELALGSAAVSLSGDVRFRAIDPREPDPREPYGRRVVVFDDHVALVEQDGTASRELARADTPPETGLVSQRPDGAEVLFQRDEELLLWRPLDAAAKMQTLDPAPFRRASPAQTWVDAQPPVRAVLGPSHRALAMSTYGVWLLPLGAAQATWVRWFHTPLRAVPCLLERPGQPTLVAAQDALELVVLDFETGKQVARFAGGTELSCDPAGAFVVQGDEGGARALVYSTATLRLTANVAALTSNASGETQGAVVATFPDGRFAFSGSRKVALAGLRCQVGTTVVPFKACEERFESPEMRGAWAPPVAP